jgi:DNA mismatch repair protein MSH2
LFETSTGASQNTIGAVLWQPRKHHHQQDNEPLEAKKGVPSHSIFVFEFIDDSNFVSLDSLVVREKPKFAFLSPKLSESDKAKLIELFQRSDVECLAPTNPASFKWPQNDMVRKKELESELSSLLNKDNLNGHVEMMSKSAALNPLSCLLAEIKCDNDNDASSMIHEMFLGTLNKFMRLDSAAADAIMLLPDKTAPSDLNGSLYGVLNQCRTSMGSRVLETWLRQPLVDRAAIEARLDLVGNSPPLT